MAITFNPGQTSSSVSVYRKQAERLEGRPDHGDRAQRGQESGESGDTISVSLDALLMTEAHRTAQGSPDVRREKVDALKEEVANGTYHVDSRKVAAGLLREESGLFRV